ncbi:hypothetical protein KO519_20330 [Paraglaciecola agarilytica]|uniref:hypothetical protein n=1 Tax=Paraglaciecola chathamensis TaxID=368405 RepID=UPI001C0A1BF2|nr:hypothetical protein [Paraglaciecola agarilytica]MBU3020026.1 hypothetical protein [Paraglaciecola agarilytica]
MEDFLDTLTITTADALINIALGILLWLLASRLRTAATNSENVTLGTIGKGCKFLALSILLPMVTGLFAPLIFEDSAEHYLMLIVDLPYLLLTVLAIFYFANGIRRFEL